MILDELTLRNFGLFAGEQTFVLRPEQKAGQHLPIVLFGGLNGGGKTTLFDAIQLVLYGPRARCSKRATLSYDDFLRQSVHHGVPLTQGASISLAFRDKDDGEEHLYEVRRSWKATEGRVREEVKVFKDGLCDSWLSENWSQLVEDLIPLEISQLFFFDAEKIRSLAEDESGGQALGTAIKSLLGLDIVERLIVDSSVLESRLVKKAGPPEQQSQLAKLEEVASVTRNQLESLNQRKAALQNDIDRAANEVRAAETAFASAGGKHWKAKQDLDRRLGELTSEISQVQGHLVALAGGELPLALVRDLLSRVKDQDDLERRGAEHEIIQRLLTERDENLLGTIQNAKAPACLLQVVRDYLAADREARSPAAAVVRRLNLSAESRIALHRIVGERLDGVQSQASELLTKLTSLTEKKDTVDRSLAATPDNEAIASLAEQLKAATQTLAVLEEQSRQLKEEIELQRREADAAEKKLHTWLRTGLEKQFEEEDLRRMVQLAGKTRDVMQKFLQLAMEQKIDRLSDLVTESFRFLLRKQTLIERVFIDPGTFSITLFDNAGHPIPKHRLSEGEKQLFAIALLWGLAKAAIRPLPAVIDTPMARLDATHRQHLVERYFPNASHQVIILSTDTEVDRGYYQMLEPYIARAYHLSYDEAKKRTTKEEGYFW